MNITLYDVMHAHMGIHELAAPGKHHPLIQFWHSLCTADGNLETPDEIAWCSSAMNGCAFVLREKGVPLTRSKMARSWLNVGVPVALDDAKIGWDVCVFWRGDHDDGVTGHVGLYGGPDPTFNPGENILVLAGNQGNRVSIEPQYVDHLLGIRRLVFAIDFERNEIAR